MTAPVRTAWTLADWRAAYRSGQLQLSDVYSSVAVDPPDTAWITRVDEAKLHTQLQSLAARLASLGGDLSRLPLYGIPFAAKDNIDAAGWLTTAACPAFGYTAREDATVIRRLREAGAILVGKTNLDQFATGLVGTRSPYGAVSNAFRSEYISGGSSAGSASVVARGLVPFSLGTDTAGSGRVPASFNNIVGLKPTRGWLSTTGVVPACRTLDCVSVFALTVEDAEEIAGIAGGYDASDAYSRPFPTTVTGAATLRLAVPDKLEFFGDAQAQAAFAAAVESWRSLGASITAIDFSPFSELAALLYEGPWVAERYAVAESLLERDPTAFQPVLLSILANASKFTAVDAFNYEYRRAALARRIDESLQGFTALLVPTTPSIYTIAQVTEKPIELNSRLGTYTNFTNLADLSALALPAGFRDDGLPAGITLLAPAWQDARLADLGKRWQRHASLPLGATSRSLSSIAQETKPAATKLRETALANLNAATAVTTERLAVVGTRINEAIAAATEHSRTVGANPAGAATVRLAVVGAHLSGMPLNHQLTSRDAVFVERCRTAATYQLYALANTTPPKPGLVKAAAGAPIEVELWDVPLERFGSFGAEIPAPLGIGSLELEDGRVVKGFICEPIGLQGARDITAFGGWRAYLASLK
ncbi:allophanate hydrolase [Steroidobacter sp.]|uniref:allophanate hydrolase n=2 Tax=Steroidobacter sp. TaxID=1978227 RepID=UPI001A5AC879|nr:allophanate hydrolase [Steroidobacter sp.]MBL8266441.1 allophanate hydrolase [Steroidobacter sp.]